MTVTDAVGTPPGIGPPRWISASLDVKEGRDPLGLQTTTQDRLMPRLLPGVLELSRRARYFSFHAYLLDKYRELRMPADGKTLSTFIKAREWEYGLAVLHCPHHCGSIPVGAQRLRGIVGHQDPPYPRGQSVESAFGGYGLYYRSPLAEFGIVARAGTLLGETPITVDVLYDTDRARRLAATFKDAVAATEYASTWMLTTDPLPLDIIVDYARVACLCQLREHRTERDAVHDALFGEDPGTPATTTPASAPVDAGRDDAAGSEPNESVALTFGPGAAVMQRRRSVAHYLTLIDADPRVVHNESLYREAMWSQPTYRSADHKRVAGLWSGLIAKDVWQDALCSIWSSFCRAGVAESRAIDDDGLTWDQVRTIARGLVGGPPRLTVDLPTAELIARIAAGNITFDGIAAPVRDATLETLRAATEGLNTASSGLVVILELHRRARSRTDPGWVASSAARSAWQPSLASVLAELDTHLAEQPTVADTLWWIVHRFIIGVHERIAYSKLPEHTFRFRWEDGRVRFFDNGSGRFPLAAIRNEPLAQLTFDLGFWEGATSGNAGDGDDNRAEAAALTERGQAFVAETFP